MDSVKLRLNKVSVQWWCDAKYCIAVFSVGP